MTVACLCDELFFRAKLEEMLRQLGKEVRFFSAAEALPEDSHLVILDGMHPEVLSAAKRFGERSLVFIRHTAELRIAELRALSARVYARSEFFAKLPTLL